jgi:hypothetical protein
MAQRERKIPFRDNDRIIPSLGPGVYARADCLREAKERITIW